MNISARSALMAGVATVTASAVLVAPSVQPLPPPRPTIQLAADAQLPALPAEYSAQLAELVARDFPAERGSAFPGTADRAAPHTRISSALDGAYHAIEPWVH